MPPEKNLPLIDIFDDDEGWEDMPIVKEDTEASGLDEEDYKKYHYRTPVKTAEAGNARGDLIDLDEHGSGWRSKRDQNESEYTRLRVKEEDDADEVHLRTRYLFDEDKAMTPLNQMQATKDLLTEAQRIAYVGLCALTTKEMLGSLAKIGGKEVKPAAEQLNLWALKILGRLYYHMELETAGIYRFICFTVLFYLQTIAKSKFIRAEDDRKSCFTRNSSRGSHPSADDHPHSGQSRVRSRRGETLGRREGSRA